MVHGARAPNLDAGAVELLTCLCAAETPRSRGTHLTLSVSVPLITCSHPSLPTPTWRAAGKPAAAPHRPQRSHRSLPRPAVESSAQAIVGPQAAHFRPQQLSSTATLLAHLNLQPLASAARGGPRIRDGSIIIVCEAGPLRRGRMHACMHVLNAALQSSRRVSLRSACARRPCTPTPPSQSSRSNSWALVPSVCTIGAQRPISQLCGRLQRLVEDRRCRCRRTSNRRKQRAFALRRPASFRLPRTTHDRSPLSHGARRTKSHPHTMGARGMHVVGVETASSRGRP